MISPTMPSKWYPLSFDIGWMPYHGNCSTAFWTRLYQVEIPCTLVQWLTVNFGFQTSLESCTGYLAILRPQTPQQWHWLWTIFQLVRVNSIICVIKTSRLDRFQNHVTALLWAPVIPTSIVEISATYIGNNITLLKMAAGKIVFSECTRQRY